MYVTNQMTSSKTDNSFKAIVGAGFAFVLAAFGGLASIVIAQGNELKQVKNTHPEFGLEMRNSAKEEIVKIEAEYEQKLAEYEQKLAEEANKKKARHLEIISTYESAQQQRRPEGVIPQVETAEKE